MSAEYKPGEARFHSFIFTLWTSNCKYSKLLATDFFCEFQIWSMFHLDSFRVAPRDKILCSKGCVWHRNTQLKTSCILCYCIPGARFTNVFCSQFISMETSTCHNSVAGHQIATNFCTCHDSTAVVPCTKFSSDHCDRIEVRVKRHFHRIWIAMQKPLVKRAPIPYPCNGSAALPIICIIISATFWIVGAHRLHNHLIRALYVNMELIGIMTTISKGTL